MTSPPPGSVDGPERASADGAPPPVRWGLRDAAIWFAVAQIGAMFWGLAALSVWAAVEGVDLTADDLVQPIGLLVVMQAGLWFAYGVGPWWTARTKGNGAAVDYGAVLRPNDGWYLFFGVALQVLVLPLIYWPILQLVDGDPSEAARDLVDRVGSPIDSALLIVLVVVAAPLTEELFFRGLLWRSLLHRWGVPVATIVSSLVFAVVHFQPLAAPGLFVFGLAAAEVTRRTGRLGPAWMLHAGFNGVTVAVLLSGTS